MNVRTLTFTTHIDESRIVLNSYFFQYPTFALEKQKLCGLLIIGKIRKKNFNISLTVS